LRANFAHTGHAINRE